MHAHAARVARERRADLEQLGADRRGAGAFEFGAVRGQTAQVDYERVGQRGQQQAQLVAMKLVATGAPAEQISKRRNAAGRQKSESPRTIRRTSGQN